MKSFLIIENGDKDLMIDKELGNPATCIKGYQWKGLGTFNNSWLAVLCSVMNVALQLLFVRSSSFGGFNSRTRSNLLNEGD